MTKPMRIEKDVKARVKKLLDKHKWFWWMPAANAFGKSGASDFMALRGHVFMVVETKIGKNKMTPMQKGFALSVLAEGGFAFCVNDTNLEWFEGFLAAFDRAVEAQSKKQPVSDDDGAYMLNATKALQDPIYEK